MRARVFSAFAVAMRSGPEHARRAPATLAHSARSCSDSAMRALALLALLLASCPAKDPVLPQQQALEAAGFHVEIVDPRRYRVWLISGRSDPDAALQALGDARVTTFEMRDV